MKGRGYPTTTTREITVVGTTITIAIDGYTGWMAKGLIGQWMEAIAALSTIIISIATATIATHVRGGGCRIASSGGGTIGSFLPHDDDDGLILMCACGIIICCVSIISMFCFRGI